MQTKQIPREQLQQYFDSFSKRFVRDDSPEGIDLEVVSSSLGDQAIAEGARLAGITYEPGTDSLEFSLGLTTAANVGHRIKSPREVWVVEEPDGFVSSLEVVRPGGIREVAVIRKVGLSRAD